MFRPNRNRRGHQVDIGQSKRGVSENEFNELVHAAGCVLDPGEPFLLVVTKIAVVGYEADVRVVTTAYAEYDHPISLARRLALAKLNEFRNEFRQYAVVTQSTDR